MAFEGVKDESLFLSLSREVDVRTADLSRNDDPYEQGLSQALVFSPVSC
jgi:hypothetical protein